ncbi:putative cytochrome c oxidase, subunit II [Candidatus Hodgkinia cicadicola Dsem]|nr:putative cytochrome c oxidase, subunit II [Candidatus Hodgkinia cicadicola Dsem]
MVQTAQLMQRTNALLLPISVITPIAIAALCAAFRGKRANAPKGAGGVSASAPLEMAWTALPLALLASICAPSLKVLRYQLARKRRPFAIVRVTAHQWYWRYDYVVDGKRLGFNSAALADNERVKFSKTNLAIYPKLLATDYELVLPARRVVRLLITSADVIHSFSVPSFGVKTDAIPGKLNDTWIKVFQPGVYYGQCAEFCGVGHAFMPIGVRVVSQREFKAWSKLALASVSRAFEELRRGALR